MFMKFQNDIGTLTFGGRESDCGLLEADGLGLPEQERQTVSYSGIRGQEELSSRLLPRIITLKCLVKKTELARFLRVLAERGRLTVTDGKRTRTAEVRCTAAENAAKMAEQRRIVIQLTADDPAFYSETKTLAPICARENLVTGSFTPPCVFTRRVNGGTLVNSGDVDATPIIRIACLAAAEDCTVTITNATTGAKIQLTHDFSAGDVITADTKNASVTDEAGVNLIACISDDTYLSDFVFRPGNNEISVVSSDNTGALTVSCSYFDGFVEAVMDW